MSNEYNILPPKKPGEDDVSNLDNESNEVELNNENSVDNQSENEPKKEGFFAKLFKRKKPKLEETELPEVPSNDEEEKLEKEFEEFTSEENSSEDNSNILDDDTNQQKIDENSNNLSDDIKKIREKLGLDKNISTKKYFDKLENEKNSNLEEESKLYDEHNSDEYKDENEKKDNSEKITNNGIENNEFIPVQSDEEIVDKSFNINTDTHKFVEANKSDFTKEHPLHKGKEDSIFTKENIYDEKDSNDDYLDNVIKKVNSYLDESKIDDKSSSNISKEITPEHIDNQIDAIKLDKKRKYSQVTKLDSDFELPKKEMPKDVDSDPRVYLQSASDIKKELGEIELETKNLLEDVKNIILEKKRKLLDNTYISPNNLKLKSILSLKEFTKTKKDFEEFKEEVLKDKISFSKWVNNVLKTQLETEKALEVELYSKVNALYGIYLNKMNQIVSNFAPVKTEDLNQFKVKEFNLNKKIKYLEDFESDLKKAKAKAISLEKKYNKGLELLKDKTVEFEKQKETELKLENKRKLDFENKFKEKELKLNQEILDRKQKLNQDIKEKEEKLNRDYNDKINKLNLEIKEKEELLEKNKKLFEEEKREIKTDITETKDKYSQVKKLAEYEYSKIHPTYIQMNKDKEEFDKRTQIVQKELKEKEDSIVQKIMYNESLMASIAKEKNELLNLKEDIDKGGFKNYLNKAIANLPEDDTINSNEDETLTHTKVIEPGMSEVDKLFDMINQCKNHLESREYSSAKKQYNELRTFFMYASLSEEQKQDLYNEIRELYDEINIKLLEEQAMYHL